MEEAGQVLEIETLIPWILQNSETSVDACRLKRVIMIGDHFQVNCLYFNFFVYVR